MDINKLIFAAKVGLINDPTYPYGESQYHNIRCKVDRDTGRISFTIDYKRASKLAVINLLCDIDEQKK